MSTIREQILNALHQTIHDIPTVEDANIFRSRTKAIDRQTTPAIVIEPEKDSPIMNVLPYFDWSLLVKIAIIVRGDTPDQLIDPILEKIHSKIMADTTLGGYSMDVQPNDVDYDFMDGDGSVCIATARYTIMYRTSMTDLTTR